MTMGFTFIALLVVLVSVTFYSAHGFARFGVRASSKLATTSLHAAKNNKVYKIQIGLGEGYQPLSIQMRPIFQNSKFFTVIYDIPFGLNVDKPPKNFPCPIVTKDSKNEDGEKEGDILRATTCWSQGFSAAGATSDIAMFAGNIKWRKSLFDTTGAPWQETLNALMSNTNERSETVTLVFERELPDEEEEQGVGGETPPKNPPKEAGLGGLGGSDEPIPSDSVE